ncbi:DddA-like double-stranded DNA deaminase toxin [Glycomyces sp. NPDC047369]
MSRLSDLLQRLRAIIHDARTASGALNDAQDQIELAARTAGAATTGSTNPLVDTGLGQLKSVQQRIAASQVLIAAGADAMEQYRTYLGGGAGGTSRPPPATATGARPARPWESHRPVPGFRPDRPNGTCIDQTRSVGWPLNRNGRTSARGRLYDAHGRPITGTVRAGPGPADAATDLHEPWSSDERMTTRWHIEGHAAAVMRLHQLKEAVLYINIPPCGTEDRGEWRCDANIAKILPRGSTLRVWVARQNGTVAQFVYRGTGEAVR